MWLLYAERAQRRVGQRERVYFSTHICSEQEPMKLAVFSAQTRRSVNKILCEFELRGISALLEKLLIWLSPPPPSHAAMTLPQERSVHPANCTFRRVRQYFEQVLNSFYLSLLNRLVCFCTHNYVLFACITQGLICRDPGRKRADPCARSRWQVKDKPLSVLKVLICL